MFVNKYLLYTKKKKHKLKIKNQENQKKKIRMKEHVFFINLKGFLIENEK